MSNVIHLSIKELFVFGVWQKIRLTEKRAISLNELTQFTGVVADAASQLNYTFFAHLGMGSIFQLVNDYKPYVKFENNALELSNNLTFQDCINIFRPDVSSKELFDIMLDEKVGKNIFEQQTVSNVK